jgi:hypothetical protein
LCRFDASCSMSSLLVSSIWSSCTFSNIREYMARKWLYPFESCSFNRLCIFKGSSTKGVVRVFDRRSPSSSLAYEYSVKGLLPIEERMWTLQEPWLAERIQPASHKVNYSVP